MRWNVVNHGHVIGELEADGFADAQRLAVAIYGIGARPSAVADPNVSAPARRYVRRAGEQPSMSTRRG